MNKGFIFTCTFVLLFSIFSCRSIYDLFEQDNIFGEWEDFQYGDWANGEFKPTPDMQQPIFKKFTSQYEMNYLGYSGYGRMIKSLVNKHDEFKISQATIRINVLDSNFKDYLDVKPVDVIFYRTGKENGKYVFETLIRNPLDEDYNPEEHGRLLLFSNSQEDQGIHGNFLVIYMRNINDNFRYELIKW